MKTVISYVPPFYTYFQGTWSEAWETWPCFAAFFQEGRQFSYVQIDWRFELPHYLLAEGPTL